MSDPDPRADWHEANQRYLATALARLRALLEGTGEVDGAALAEAAARMASPPALDVVTRLFALTPFERDVLLLAAAVELDGSFVDLCRGRQGGDAQHPTFGLALAALPEAHWTCLTATAPLRYWRLVRLGAGAGLTSRELRIDERILHYLVGLSHLDAAFEGLVEHVVEVRAVSPTHRRLALEMLAAWSRPPAERFPLVELCGADAAGKVAVAALACAEASAPLLRLDAAELPHQCEERESLALLWEREALLTGAVLLVDCEELEPADRRRAIAFMRRLRCRIVATVSEPLAARRLDSVRLDVARPAGSEARGLWLEELGPAAVSLNGRLEAVVGQFELGLDGIRTASERARRAGTDADAGSALWRACRAVARPRLEGLAQRIDSRAGWEDLVLPGPQLETLRDVALHLRWRSTVYDDWGFARQSARGLGFSALFAGDSGTGKTMAAEVLARDLDLDLYRIDLSQVVSKYIGETEKNLARVFEAAEGGGAILLFDEADALFGKRSEVKDSHDRYANIEVSYLLQRMESYRGLAVLTTNLRNALDSAFLRRLRFVVHFPFPDEAQREAIWRRIFPSQTPVEPLDFGRLARLNLTGGNIRNIAMAAAFLAAEAGQPVGPGHIARAARGEYAKLEKPPPDAELRRLVAGGQAA